jgi:hypothetical protein
MHWPLLVKTNILEISLRRLNFEAWIYESDFGKCLKKTDEYFRIVNQEVIQV